MSPLFVYGTLRPGQSNAHLLEKIGGEWLQGYVTGRFYDSGWGAATGFPGVILDPDADRIDGWLFISERLTDHWPMLDEFEDGYDRILTEVTTADNRKVNAWIYQLQPRVA